jgi:hypothetical protein
MQRKFDFITVYNQSHNIGFSMNLRFLWAAAKSEYVWTISDDDFYSEELIQSVINLTCFELVDTPIIINSFHYIQKSSSSNTLVLRADMLNLKSESNILKYKNGLKDLVTKENFTAFGLISSTIFPISVIKHFIFDFPEIETSYPHQLLLFKELSSRELVVLNCKKGLGWRAEESNWNLDNVDQSFQAHFIDYLEILKESHFVSYSLRRKIYKLIYINSYKASLIFSIKYRKGFFWVIKTFLVNHLRYTCLSITHDPVLLLSSIVKSKSFNTFLLKVIDRCKLQPHL